MDILLVLHKLIAHLLEQIRAAIAKLRKVLYRLLHQVEAVHIVLHAHIEGRSDGTLFLIAAHMHETVVVAPIGQLVHQ